MKESRASCPKYSVLQEIEYNKLNPLRILPTSMTRVEEDGVHGNDGVIGDIIHPIERGIIKDWDAMEDLWRYTFYTGLGWEPGNEGQLLVAEPLLTPKVSRERMVQTMFETFNVGGLYAVEQAVLSLYAVGRITGVVIDAGHGKIDIAPVWEGAIQHNAVKRFEISGQDLTDFLAKELARSQPDVKLDLATVEMLKEKYAAVAEDSSAYVATAEACPKIQHTLPDGQVISVGRERYDVGEALLRPSIFGIEEDGLAEQLLRSVSTCSPSENQRQLIENIVLCGGTSMIRGLDSRFQKEAVLVANPSVRPSLIKPPEYMPDNTLINSAWMGGAILAKVVFPQNQHITKAEYDEAGPPIVHRKCF
ncbi:actin-related protein 7 isoform X3 [Physcomitrium patens]|uniref:actin-related protein 7 isoform X3 n=1 Tax=Physcomitrium patens TaxID=3218 RepID=UPI000D17D090|nr:actin-related protein 7-like isoform X3 [Physcomitrium patens]|eukprot:XP_024359893.1 actin-related protein 7-like isoform X3 [Physcomitrella patens]